jgi:uncharacterized protein (DUF885 family)
VLLVGCARGAAPAPATGTDDAARVQQLALEYTDAYAQMFPDRAEYYGKRLAHHDSLPDNSPVARRSWQRREDAWLGQLRQIDAARLWGAREWALYGYLRSGLESAVATRPCRTELWQAHQFGWQTTLLTLLENQPLGTADARAEALARWGQLARFLDIEISNLREGVRLGYTAPRHNVELALSQLDALLAQEPGDSAWLGPAQRDAEPQFRARWQVLVETQLLPATRRYRDFLRDEYVWRARTSLAVTALPDGAACYQGQIETFTTTQIEPDAVYRLGQQLLDEREAKALGVARRLFGNGVTDLQQARAALDADPRNRFASREQALRFVAAALERAERAAPRYFARVPRSPLTLVPYPDFETKTHPGARYQPAAQDGSHPARFRIDGTSPKLLWRSELEDTAFHEGIPGHHLQIGLEQESSSLVERADISGLGAFIEGWARYGESLAD